MKQREDGGNDNEEDKIEREEIQIKRDWLRDKMFPSLQLNFKSNRITNVNRLIYNTSH
jgi:hypothetical protein